MDVEEGFPSKRMNKGNSASLVDLVQFINQVQTSRRFRSYLSPFLKVSNEDSNYESQVVGMMGRRVSVSRVSLTLRVRG